MCSCRKGYKIASDGRTCEGKCFDISQITQDVNDQVIST